MNASDSKPLFSPEQALGVMDLIYMTLMAHGLEDLADRMLRVFPE